MWYGHLARHRQDACATSFTSERSTLYRDLDILKNKTSLSHIQNNGNTPYPQKESSQTQNYQQTEEKEVKVFWEMCLMIFYRCFLSKYQYV